MLRHADPTDLLYIQAILNAPDNLGKLEAYADELVLAAIESTRTAVFIWEEDGQWGGFCWLQLTPEGTKVEEFGVSIPGRGIGSRFFAAVLDQINRDDCPTPVWLNVAADNSDAIRFYQRFGFVGKTLQKSVWKRRKGPVADALTMTRATGPRPSHATGNQYMT